MAFDGLISEKPCGWIRIALERVIFIESEHGENSFFGEESFESFMRRDVQAIHPLYKPFMNEQLWNDFFEKYILMTREYLLTCLRNPARQHRYAKRFCKD